jgi:anhydro-N-acetylmuramic acid kinase
MRASAGLSSRALYLGIMSGTSLDGADAVVADFSAPWPKTLAFASTAFAPSLRAELLALNSPGHDEVDRAARAANGLADLYAELALRALAEANIASDAVVAIGCHGQTIRHRPELGYSVQLNNPARLAELTGIDVVSDFRSRDLAAGGQGAPLVPLFHDGVFRAPDEARVVVNIGGIANLTVLEPGRPAWGFDCGPGNCLMDLWTAERWGMPFDGDGKMAASGRCLDALLQAMQADAFFRRAPPKSTGRDLFHRAWLAAFVEDGRGARPADVLATLLELTAWGVADHIQRHVPSTARLLLCGGGARNGALRQAIARRLPGVEVDSTLAHGIDPQHVEALAFAWLAKCAIERRALDYSRTTGARGPRVIGCVTPA